MDLRHEEEIHSPSSATYKAEDDSPTVDVGIDLSEFYMSVEWDILEVGSLYRRYHVVPLNMKMQNRIVYFELGLTAFLTAKSTEIAAFRFLPRETSSSTLVVMNLIWTLHSTSQCAGRHYSTQ